MNSAKLQLELLDLYSMHVNDVSNEEVKELLGTLLVGTDLANRLNAVFGLSLVVLQHVL